MLRQRLTDRGLVLPETTITDDVEEVKNEEDVTKENETELSSR